MLDAYEKVPLTTLTYLIGECNYGGRVTEDIDRTLIKELLCDYYTPEIFKSEYKFSSSGIYYAPPEGTYEDYLKYINSLPDFTSPEAYGFHENADITKDHFEANLMLSTILVTRSGPRGGEGGGDI
mmetsp:Transcript_14734/g.7205  ORF Transcript_14734/g.7205 Transcript_14734/m.7205 type:complete len:126 (-) Transcript_14734:866-1243(-)